MVSSKLAEEIITVAEDARWFAGENVDGPCSGTVGGGTRPMSVLLRSGTTVGSPARASRMIDLADDASMDGLITTIGP